MRKPKARTSGIVSFDLIDGKIVSIPNGGSFRVLPLNKKLDVEKLKQAIAKRDDDAFRRLVNGHTYEALLEAENQGLEITYMMWRHSETAGFAWTEYLVSLNPEDYSE